MVAGLTLAWLPVHLLRAPPASVRPGGGAVVAIAYESMQKRSVKLDERVRFDTSDGSFTFNVGRRYVQVEPLLSFNQRSPDGCWTIFAPRADRLPPTRTLIGHTVANGKAEAAFTERDHRRTWAEHHVSAQVNADMLAIEAVATLHATTWSHLNTFTQVTVAGHKRLRVKFSGMREPIDVLPLGYPAGAPARFAYMDAVRRLHVVEAHSGEKGPYRDLVPPMPIDGPVMITLLDGDVPFVELTLNDWATQASVAASPTAGWGVPQNAIEFSLIGDGPTSPATFHVTLAATSVGRGWNSVAHPPGQYMNRLDVRWLAP